MNPEQPNHLVAPREQEGDNPMPSQREIESLEIAVPELFEDNPHVGCYSKYEFNLLNLRAYLDNWDVLDPTMKKTLLAFMESDLTGNCFKNGMKRYAEFLPHLLFLTGCAIWNIRDYKETNMVLSNLRRNNGLYPERATKNRIIDPRTCNNAARRFLKNHNVALLFRDFDAVLINFESNDSYHYQPEVDFRGRDSYKAFFKQNVALLKKWTRSKVIYSYIYSNEVSCDSILAMRFRPHTHAIVFFPKGTPAPDLQGAMGLADRSLKSLDKVHTNFGTLERFVRYLHGAYSLVSVYRREYVPDNILHLNRNAVNALHAIIDLAGAGRDEPGYKRCNSSYIPLAGDADNWKHPLLKRKRAKQRRKQKAK